MPFQNRLDHKYSVVLDSIKPEQAVMKHFIFPVDFRMACVIAGFSGETVLQHFIDQIARFSVARQVLYQYAALDERPPESRLHRRGQAVTLPLLRYTWDYYSFCSVLNIDPASSLQYFIDLISLPRMKAEDYLRAAGSRNPAMRFFLAMARGKTGLGRRIGENTRFYFRYIRQIQELDLRLLFNQNVDERERAYRKVYEAWYESLLNTK